MFELTRCREWCQYLLVRQVLDPMHCEKKLCKNIMNTIWGIKDTLKVRLDMKEVNIRPELHPVEDGRSGLTLLPTASYVMTKSKETMFIKTIRELKTPSNYVGQFVT